MKTVFMRSSTSLLRNSDDIFSVGFFHYKHSQRGHIDRIPFGDNENIDRFSGSFTRCIGRHQRSRHNHPGECATRNDVWLSPGGTGWPASRSTPSRAPSYYACGRWVDGSLWKAGARMATNSQWMSAYDPS